MLFGPTRQVRLSAERLDLAFGVGDLLAQGLDLAGEPLAGIARLVLLSLRQALQEGVGDGIGDPRGKLGIFRQEIDDDDVRLLHREHGEPVVIGVEHALLRRHAQRILDDADERQQRLPLRQAADGGIEFRQLVQLKLGDDVARHLARHHQLRLAGDGVLVDGAAVEDVLVGVGAQKDVVAADDEDARLGLIFRRDHHHHAESEKSDDQRRPQDRVARPPQRGAKACEVEIGVDELPAQRRPCR